MKEQKISILIRPDASFDEVVDSLADVFNIAFIIEKSLADGFQLTDLLQVIQVEPLIREVINDFPVFLQQFRQLNGSTAMAAAAAARDRAVTAHGNLGKVGTFIFGFLNETASTYALLESTVVNGTKQLNDWKALFDTLKPVQA